MPCFQTNPLVVTPPRLGPSKYSDCPCHCVPSSKDHTSQQHSDAKQSARRAGTGAEAGNVPLRAHRYLEHATNAVLKSSAQISPLTTFLASSGQHLPLASTISPPLKSMALHRFILQAVRFSPHAFAMSRKLPKFREVWQEKKKLSHTRICFLSCDLAPTMKSKSRPENGRTW